MTSRPPTSSTCPSPASAGLLLCYLSRLYPHTHITGSHSTRIDFSAGSMSLDDPLDFPDFLVEPPEDFAEYNHEYPSACSWELIHDSLPQSSDASQRILLQLVNLTLCSIRAKRQELWPMSFSSHGSSELSDFTYIGSTQLSQQNVSHVGELLGELVNSSILVEHGGFVLKDDLAYVVVALIIFPILIVAIILGNLIVVVAIITDKRLQVCLGLFTQKVTSS